MKRRQFVRTCAQAGVLGSFGLLSGARALPSSDEVPVSGRLRIGTTPVFLNDHLGFLGRWGPYLGGGLGMPVEFVERRAYRDVMALLRSGEIDAAWICGYPWVVNRQYLRGLVLPLWQGEPWYRSYLIVPAHDTTTTNLRDLRGRAYAFSDPDSNSGCLVPRATLVKEGIDPDHHFGRTFFTWGHPNVVRAVGSGLADGGSVDGYVWETLQLSDPELTKRTRVAWRSDKYGFPPLAVRSTLPMDVEVRLRDVLIGMVNSTEGKALLSALNLTAFGPFREDVFDGIAKLVEIMASRHR